MSHNRPKIISNETLEPDNDYIVIYNIYFDSLSGKSRPPCLDTHRADHSNLGDENTLASYFKNNEGCYFLDQLSQVGFFNSAPAIIS